MIQMNDENLWRHEYKYLCNAVEIQILQSRVEGLLPRDAHAAEAGSYRIRSLYFDDYYNTAFYENEDGTEPRTKFRLRFYNGDTSFIVLEKKEKKRGMTHKESCVVEETVCRELMQGQWPDITCLQSDILRKLILQMRLKNLRPVQIVEYERIPFIEPNGNVRITFDSQISSSQEVENFLEQSLVVRPILEIGQSLMEVKWDTHLPDYIRTSLELDTLHWSTFSKFYLCRKFNCKGELL